MLRGMHGNSFCFLEVIPRLPGMKLVGELISGSLEKITSRNLFILGQNKVLIVWKIEVKGQQNHSNKYFWWYAGKTRALFWYSKNIFDKICVGYAIWSCLYIPTLEKTKSYTIQYGGISFYT